MRSALTPPSTSESTEALAEEATIVIPVTSASPIIRADAVAAVRRGFRTVLARASIAGVPPTPGPADGPGEHRGEGRRQRDRRDQEGQCAESGELRPGSAVRLECSDDEQPGGQGQDGEPDEHPPTGRSLRSARALAQRLHRGDLPGPAQRQ